MLRLVNTDTEMQTKLEALSRRSWRKDRYKYFHGSIYCRSYYPKTDAESMECWAVVDDKNPDSVLGYIRIDIIHNNFWISCAVNYSDDIWAMGNALYDLVSIAITQGYHKIAWRAIGDNPIVSTYEKMCRKLGGRVESRIRDDVRTWDNVYHDSLDFGVLISEIPLSIRKSFEKRYERRKDIMFY